MTVDQNIYVSTNNTEPSPFYMLEAIYKALCVDKNASVNIVGADVKVDVQVAPEVQVKGDAADPLPCLMVGSLMNQITLLDARTTKGYGPPLAMGGQNNVDFSIKGVGITALTINFYKVSPSGGLHPIVCSKDNSDGTITLAASTSVLPTAGTEVSAASPSTDIHSATSPTFQIAVDGDVGVVGTPNYQSVTLNPSVLTTGAAIASAMQTTIRALGGIYAAVTVAYGSTYTITSGTQGASSKVRVANGLINDIGATLKIGAVNNAINTDGISEAWNANVPAGWSLQLYVASLTGTSVTALGTVGVI